MRKIKFLHCADIHLDMPFTSLGTDGKSSIRRQELKDSFKKIIDTAKAQKVDMLLISGDLYEHNYVRKSTITFVNDCFSEIPDIKIFIVPGNHDPYVLGSYYRNFSWNKNVCILTTDNPQVVLEDLKTSVHGVGFNNFYEEKSLISSVSLADPEYINILVVHGTVDMIFNKSAYNPMTGEELGLLGMDYVALGHFHGRADTIGGRAIYNSGSPEPLGFDETGDHGVFVGTITQEHTGKKHMDVQFLKLNKRYYQNVEVNIDGCATDEQVVARVISTLGDGDKVDGLFNITLKGYLESGFKINAEYIRSYLGDRVFFVTISDETATDYNFDEIAKEPGLRGLFVRKTMSLLDNAQDEQRKKILKKTLYYGIEALEQGRVDI